MLVIEVVIFAKFLQSFNVKNTSLCFCCKPQSPAECRVIAKKQQMFVFLF